MAIRSHLLVICWLSFVVNACASPPANVPRVDTYVGLRHPPVPASVDDLGGALVGDGTVVRLAVTYTRDSSGDMLWLDRFTHRDDQGRAYWQVVDALRLGRLKRGEGIVLGNCTTGEIDHGGDGFTYAVVTYEDREILTRVRLAWRVDPETERFVPLAPTTVRCVNEGYGA